MIDDVDELLALRAGDKYRLNDIRRRLEIYKRLYISDLEFVRNLSKAYLGKDLSPEPRRPRPGETQAGSGSCSSCGSKMGADEAFCTNCGAKKAGQSTPPTSSAPESPSPKPRRVQAGTGNKSRQQLLEEYERQYLSKSGIKDGARGFTITEDGEVGKKTRKKAAKPRKSAKKTTTKTRKPKKEKEPESGFCVKCGSKIATDDMFCTNCGSKR
jgi:pyruvate/2-oxoglutarate dehydrogenase complex dihydrolipoamide acyltransferase (E2) component